VASPSPGNLLDTLTGVFGASTSQAWAVGSYQTMNGPQIITKPLMLHWDGTAWTRVRDGTDASDLGLTDIAGTSPSDVWASIVTGTGSASEHWNGTTWTQIPFASVSGLSSISHLGATSPTDVWAAGFQVVAGGDTQTLVEHWDGTAWTVVPSPNGSLSSSSLLGILGTAPNDAWAVGTTSNEVTSQGLAMHWDGAVWTLSTLPQLPASSIVSDAGAVGSRLMVVGSTQTTKPVSFALTWTGLRWQRTAQFTSTGGTSLTSVATTSAGEAWAVGQMLTGPSTSVTLIEHRASPADLFTQEASPSPGASNVLRAVARSGDGHLWAVGDDMSDATPHTLIEESCP
jgi:hypothetical protein